MRITSAKLSLSHDFDLVLERNLSTCKLQFQGDSSYTRTQSAKLSLSSCLDLETETILSSTCPNTL